MSRPTIAEVDLDAIVYNYRQIVRLIGPSVKICPAVKADAYGHGAIEVSRVLVECGAAMLGVATIEEGAGLRESGISIPVLVLGSNGVDVIDDILHYDLSVTLTEWNFAVELSKMASSAGKTVTAHVKVDTGMGRLGLLPENAIDFIVNVSKLPNIKLDGIFTHFPSADNDLDFSSTQVELFNGVIEKLNELGINIPIRHAANSAGIINMPSAHYEMVRPGILIYGLYDGNPEIVLRQAMTLKTGLTLVKDLPAGSSISYGRAYIADRKTRVAVMPIGYADGYNRGLSNKGSVLIRGKRTPIIGRVCMDMTMLDVSHIPDVEIGDEVVLFGKQGDEFISVNEIAQKLGTITYEVICSVSKRVPREYLRRGTKCACAPAQMMNTENVLSSSH